MGDYIGDSIKAARNCFCVYVPFEFTSRYVRQWIGGNDMYSLEPFIFGAASLAFIEMGSHMLKIKYRGRPTIFIASSLTYLLAAYYMQ